MLKRTDKIDERLKPLESGAETIQDETVRLRLKIAIQELRVKLEHDFSNPWVSAIKFLGTAAISFGAVWTLYDGILEYSHAAAQRKEEPFLQAMSELTDPKSTAQRVSALQTVERYMNDPKAREPGKDDEPSLYDMTVMVLAIRVSEEPSPILRSLIVQELESDSRTEQESLMYLVTQNEDLTTQVRKQKSQLQTDASDLSVQLWNSANAIGAIVRNIESDPKAKADGIDLEPMSKESSQVVLTLNGADLRSVKLIRTDFGDTDFTGTQLAGADLLGAVLREEAVNTLCLDKANISAAWKDYKTGKQAHCPIT